MKTLRQRCARVVTAAVVVAGLALSGGSVGATDYYGQLYSNDVIYQSSGDTVYSPNEDYYLTIGYSPEHETSQLEFFSPSSLVWQSYWDGYSSGLGNHKDQWYVTEDTDMWAVMQSDGNFVLYKSYAYWDTGTSGSGNYLNVQNDGNLVIYSSTDVALWSRF